MNWRAECRNPRQRNPHTLELSFRTVVHRVAAHPFLKRNHSHGEKHAKHNGYVNLNRKNLKGCLAAIVVAFVAIELIGLLLALMWGQPEVASDLKPIALDTNKTRVLCLGESTTANDSWPDELQGLLNKKWPNEYEIINRGKTGINTSYVSGHIDEMLAAYQPAIVIGMLGINDDLYISKLLSKENRSVVEKLFSYKILHYLKDLLAGRTSMAEEKFHLQEQGLNPSKSFSIQRTQQEIPYSTKGEVFASKLTLMNDYRRAGQYDRLLETLNSCVQRWPNDLWLRFRRMKVLLQLGHARLLDDSLFAPKDLIEQEAHFFEEKGAHWNDELGKAYIFPFDKWVGPIVHDPHYFGRGKHHLEKARQGGFLSEVGTTLLAKAYLREGQAEQAKKLIEASLAKGKSSGELLLLYKSISIGKDAALGAQAQFGNLERRIEISMYSAATLEHLNYTINAVLNAGANYVFMQYPLRTLEYVRQHVEKTQKVLFIENNENFKTALQTGEFQDLFSDRFAGDFGHLTTRGNQLLAASALSAIVQTRQN
jgi:tetratricopeptide (TPR) repeat protein